MKTRMFVLALAFSAVLAGCNKKSVSANTPSDAVEQKLQQLAGTGAQNCGRVKSINENDTKPASDCAMQAAKAKKPFYVAYDMPGLTVAVGGSSDGKLYAVQSQAPTPAEGQKDASQPKTSGEVTVSECPSELRLASSGRVTCYAAGSFGASSGANPHGGGMTMPPGMTNPHGGAMPMPPPGTPNPHGGMGQQMPPSHGSSGKADNSGGKPASKQ